MLSRRSKVEAPKLSTEGPVYSKSVPRMTSVTKSLPNLPVSQDEQHSQRWGDTSMVLQTSPSNGPRVRDVGDNKAASTKPDTVHIHIEVNVQSINFSKSLDSTDASAQAKLYISTLMHFSQLVCENFAGVLTATRRGMKDNYSCEVTQVGRQSCGLTLDVMMPRKKLVGFQCEQSSGQLAKDLEQWLVNKKMMGRLAILEMRLSTEVNS